MSILKVEWLEKRKAQCDQHRLRSAEDISLTPDKFSHRKRGLSAHMNWSDWRAFSDALTFLLPDLVYYPAIYIGGGLNGEAPPQEIIPIHRNFMDCLQDPTHGLLVAIVIRWPWPDEAESSNADILAGNIHGAASPWFDPPWRLPTKWSRQRRRGRMASIYMHFQGYERLQDIEQRQAKPFWGARKDSSGRRQSDAVPESWVFRDASVSYLNASYILENSDDAFFCELLLELWCKCSTDLFGLYDALDGEVLSARHKVYDFRYGWNALKHGVSGRRHFLSVGYGQDDGKFYAQGPAVKQVKRAMLSPDLEPFDAYDFIYPRERLPLLPRDT